MNIMQFSSLPLLAHCYSILFIFLYLFSTFHFSTDVDLLFPAYPTFTSSVLHHSFFSMSFSSSYNFSISFILHTGIFPIYQYFCLPLFFIITMLLPSYLLNASFLKIIIRNFLKATNNIMTYLFSNTISGIECCSIG
jgi:hypothetical protein